MDLTFFLEQSPVAEISGVKETVVGPMRDHSVHSMPFTLLLAMI